MVLDKAMKILDNNNIGDDASLNFQASIRVDSAR
jgi:hypothetical protein